jgi:hypothetical protein
MERNPSWEVSGFSNWSRKATWLFITVFIIAHYLTLFWAGWIHSSSFHLTSLWSIFILSSHLCLVLPNSLFLSCLPANTLYAFLFFPQVLHNTIQHDIFYCNWVSTRWQWSVDLHRNWNRQLYKKWETTHRTIQKHRIHNIEKKLIKQENRHKRVFKKSSN